jgi:putative ABC transport system substrate-binding protein
MSRKARKALVALVPVLLLAALALVLVLRQNHGTVPLVGVFLVADHPAVKQIHDGFGTRLTRDLPAARYDVQNANGDASRFSDLATYFSDDRFDLVFVVGTPCVQAMKSRDISKPILFAGVPDPVAAGLVVSRERPGGNITGAYLFPPIEPLLDRLSALLPAARRIGVIYNSGEPNSQSVVSRFRDVATARGLNVLERTVAGTAEIDAALSSLLGHVDALYIPTDSSVQIALQTIVVRAAESGLPTLASDTAAVRRGCLFGVAGDYQDLGDVAGGMALRLLSGESPSTMPLETIRKPTFSINIETARRLQVQIPETQRHDAMTFDEWERQ